MKRASKILRDVCGLILASALAFAPIAAVHSCAQAHPLVNASGAESEDIDTADEIDAQALSSYYLTNGNFATSVKLQNPWGACWAFAIASAVESSILKAQAKLDGTYSNYEKEASEASSPKLSDLNDAIDISERAIAWLSHELQDEASAGTQAGEGLYRTDPSDYTTQLAGGNFSIVEAALATRQELLLESSAPYQYNGYYPGAAPWYSDASSGADARRQDWSLNNSLRNTNDVGWYVSDIVNLASPAVMEYDPSNETVRYIGYDANATREIKQALVDIGAVAISLEAETSLPGDARSASHFDYNTWAQYDAASSIFTNHAVTIVGWDDSYSASNFSGTESGQPPANGAWLCKNNWGSDALYNALGGSSDATHWGISDNGKSSGFFWLSYYDHTITSPVAFEVKPTESAHNNIYQYDYLGVSEYSEPSSYADILRVGNVFTAEKTELVKSITAQTFHENEVVSYWIYTLPMKNGGEDNNGALAASADCTFEHAGFHEIELDSPVLVAAGQQFAVVERVKANTGTDTDAAEASYLNLELAFKNPPTGDIPVETMAQVVSNPGETYISIQPDSWMSLQEFNDWYADTQNGTPDMIFGNALIKALTNDTSMSNDSQVYKLVCLNE
ncbi:lectin like domain-containing protein [Adlercreutzia sp. ZJ304]|uniref:lectin like domain-containing protein n=1 Tax=Adlercreutzia sp. ZJ304 TaxID=2709791 RepID=UPI0013E9EE20|nr:lectin like domain-containing protein [Adlercreutzia sp. ZJ304]